MNQSKELNFELLRFQRYISDHDLETQMEIENDKIVFQVGKKFIKWNVEEAQQFQTNIMTDAEQSYRYAKNVIKGRFELGEPVISKKAYTSYWYAEYVLNGRFELGEPAIAKDPEYSLWYATDVIKGRFELGESVISKSAFHARLYDIENF